jgi:hypothetical protein
MVLYQSYTVRASYCPGFPHQQQIHPKPGLDDVAVS